MVGDRVKVVKGDDEDSERIDGELVLFILKPKEIEDELEKEASDKVLEIHQKHEETREPVYDELNEILQPIDNFWLNFFLEPLVLGKHLTDEDQKILKYLDALYVEDSKDVESGYSINFNFRPNPFFEDSKLTKTFTFLDEGTRITATSIKWKEGMGLPNGDSCQKKGNKGPLSGESFFHWFSDAEHKDVTAEIHDEIADLIMNSWANYYFDADKAYGRSRLLDADKAYGHGGIPYGFNFVAPQEGQRVWGTTSYNHVSEEETAAAYVYKMDRPWLRPDEVRVEIWRGHALWVIGQGDEPVKVKLLRNNKMRMSEATASMNADGVLTIMIPKRSGPRKWYEYKDLVFAWFKTVRVEVSS